MARPFILPNQQYLDGNGAPLAGGKLYFYIANSSTPKATYADPEGNTPNANPLILDADGRAKFYGGSGLYKVKLTDADDVELWSVDDVDCNPTDAEDGLDGKSVRYGDSDPTSGDGNEGDFWINRTTHYFFGPKAEGEWPTGVSLVGPAGAAGADGFNDSGPHSVTDGQSATDLTGETFDSTEYSSVLLFAEIIRGTTVVVTGQMSLHDVNGTWALRLNGFSGIHGVTFSISQATTVATLKAALDSGAGNGTIKLKKTYFAA